MTMDMNQVYRTLEQYFDKGDLAGAEDFLIEKLKEAQAAEDYPSLIMLLNEMMGFCRETGQKEKSLGYGGQVLTLMEQLGMRDSEAYGTTLLNVATACRAAGKYAESYQFYMQIFPLYEKHLPAGDYRFASLYNNMSLLFQETEEYERSAEYLGKALAILNKLPDREYEIAVTHANMASTLCKIAETEQAEDIAAEALEEAEQAIGTFEKMGIRDVHAAAALSAKGDAYVLMRRYAKALPVYEAALAMIAASVGKTQGYARVEDKLQYARLQCEQMQKESSNEPSRKKETVSGLALARDYFEACGKPMLQEQFPEYMDRMAVGLCGEGSDCLGYDDEVSRDHDFGPRFTIFVAEDVYEQIGERLKEAYESLPKSFRGYERTLTEFGQERTGVCTYEQYFQRILGIPKPPETEAEWLYVEESALRAAVSGEIFLDGDGRFTELIEKTKLYYNGSVYKRKLMQELTLFEQNGSYNYSRMVERGDMASANLMLVKAAENAAHLIYLFARIYCPHPKWLLRGLEDCPGREEMKALVRKLLTNLHDTSGQMSSEEKEKVQQNTTMLLRLRKLMEEEMKEQLVDEIVQMEWKAFDQVKNEGGRAGCQDDFTTFEIMRKSQYMTWTTEMLTRYKADFALQTEKGWNPITEKYARMMESTTPEKYAQLADSLPSLPEEKKAIIEGIVSIQVAWMEAFATQYPKVAGNARSIHTYEDTPYNTSYETYLRGELGTYSDEMLLLYGAFIAGLAKAGQNLAEQIMTQTVHMYGYPDLKTAEEKMW